MTTLTIKLTVDQQKALEPLFRVLNDLNRESKQLWINSGMPTPTPMLGAIAAQVREDSLTVAVLGPISALTLAHSLHCGEIAADTDEFLLELGRRINQELYGQAHVAAA